MKQAALAHQIVGSTFGFYSPDDIRKISVKKIESVQTFDALGNPVKNGLYDPALGPMDAKHGNCATCGLSEAECPGHFGHIELPVPIYNPIVFSSLLRLIKLVCFNCHHLRLDTKKSKRYAELLHLVNCGKLDVARELEAFEDKDPDIYKKDDEQYMAQKLKRLKDFDLSFAGEDVIREQTTKNMLNYRKELIIKCLKAVPTEKCENCGAFKLPIKKDGLKLFQKRLSTMNANKMRLEGKFYRSVLSKKDEAENEEDEFNKWLFNSYHESDTMQVLEEDPMDVEEDKDKTKKKSKKSKKTKKNKGDKDEEEETNGKDAQEEKGKKASTKKKTDEEPINTIKKARGKKGSAPADDINQRLMSPLEVREHMKLVWNNDKEIIELIYSSLVKGTDGEKLRISSHDIFFLQVIAVPPTRFRPPAELGGQLTEHAQNVYLSKVLNIIHQMEIYKKQSDKVKVGAYTDLWNQLQTSVQLMMDNTPGPANKNPPGIKQLLEKKEGLFRKNMMGKRVDYAARSVISPDPYIETNEIGVPLYFAKTLNYPEPVTAHNVAWLRKLVMNGPTKHPGANKIEDEFGNVIVLPPHDDARRAGIAKTLTKPNISSQYGFGVKKVYRHLMDGDFLLVNRQPTLHKPSIMAHKARILGLENTIQMHYANCNTYNADFDGDEMNLHFAQSELSRAEASQLVITDQQYVVPKDGTPLRGLIQDHILSGVYLTCRDTFLTRERFQQLFYGCCWNTNPKNPLLMPTPAILKPQPLWTGKQLASAVLHHLTFGKRPLNLVSKSQIPDEMWGKGSGEATIIIRQNDLMTGVLGKKQFGNKAHGLVHAVYELYGAEMAGKLLTTLGRLFTLYLQFRGFTCGMDDLLLSMKAEKKRAGLSEESNRCGMKQAGIFTGIIPQDDPELLDRITDQAERRAMEAKIMARLTEMVASPDEAHNWDKFMISHLGGVTSSVIEACLPSGQIKAFPKNNLAMMTISGAKGSRVNFSQISCLLGQQELEGRRVPRMVTGQTLPCFAPYDTSPRAGGFVADRFLTGVGPVEYFFHCMAGREGLIDTAVKTSRSGYLQRCIIKHMESLTVNYDHTVRDHDGSVIQFYYGDDGIDVGKTGFLYEFDFLSENLHILLDSYDTARAGTLPVVPNKEMRRALKKHHKYDPILNKYNPGVYLGAVSEKFENAIKSYIENNSDKFSKTPNKQQIDPDVFRQMMYLKYVHSLAHPGEAVGVLAGQSIGEPSTQMTLNTFHLAGKGEVNVTLGIPRMRELILTGGSTTTTPSMILPLKKEYGLKEAQSLAARLQRYTLMEVLDDIIVKESLETQGGVHVRMYDVQITFKEIDKKSYTWKFFKNVLERKFLPNFLRKISEILKVKKPPLIGKEESIKFDEEIIRDIQSVGDDDAVPTKSQAKGGDEDGYSSIQRNKKKDFATYDEADEDEKKMIGKQAVNEEEELDDEEEEENNKKTAEQADDKEKEETNASGEENFEDKKMNKQISHECLDGYEFNAKEQSLTMRILAPADKPKLLIVSLLEEMAETFCVRNIPGIKRCFVIKPNKDDSRYKIQTEGINFGSIWRLSNLLEIRDIYTNHVPTIASTYGIEAGRASMVSEISAVFKAYGITVDPRHLALVGDSMCFEGVIRAMNRGGINSNTSPYLKMSFETTMAFLTDAAIHGDYDRIQSPSSQITLGRLSKTGTGAFDIRHDLTYLERHKPKA